LIAEIVWIFFKIKKTANGKSTTIGILAGNNYICNYIWTRTFAHYRHHNSNTHIIVARAIILNGIGGIIFGWLYWKKGLESAIISHFSLDIILQDFLLFRRIQTSGL
jgi:hypothetical protein